MTIESSAIPFPSEIVIPPAGALAQEGRMSLTLVILCGGVGSVIGAMINYVAALWLGRPFFERYGKYFLVTEEKLKKADDFFERYGAIATLTCRFITVIRQLVSIPAGLARMNLTKFVLYTAIGSTLWSAVLAFFGYFLGAGEDVLKEYKGSLTVAMVILAVAIIGSYVAYVVVQRRRTASVAATHGAPGEP
ncbi:DedA family protein [bacterium]|nr:DedA family protein [bacterium]